MSALGQKRLRMTVLLQHGPPARREPDTAYFGAPRGTAFETWYMHRGFQKHPLELDGEKYRILGDYSEEFDRLYKAYDRRQLGSAEYWKHRYAYQSAWIAFCSWYQSYFIWFQDEKRRKARDYN